MQLFWGAHQAWADDTFGGPRRAVEGPLKHLEKEINEIREALASRAENVDEEFADATMLLFDAARLAGLSYRDLLGALFRKLGINMTRTWSQPAVTLDAPVEHVRG